MKAYVSSLIDRTFEMFVQKRWLKTIDKEIDKYNKLKGKCDHQMHVISGLLKEYNKLYGTNFNLGISTERGAE